MRKIKISLFSVYIFIVLWLTLINRKCGERRAMLIPFWEYANVIKNIGRSYYIEQIFCNFMMLMPLGFMLPTIKNVRLKHIFIMSVCFSAGIELTQFITGRGLMEFDDVFNNVYSVRNALQFFTIPAGYFLGGFLVDKIFEPFMEITENKLLCTVFGREKGAGASLLFFVIGIAGVLICLIFRRIKYIHELE